MLRITVDIIPFGLGTPKTLGKMEIWNNVTGTKSIGNYSFRIFRKGSDSTVWKSGDIKGFKRLQFGVWDLLFACLKEAVSERKSIFLNTLEK